MASNSDIFRQVSAAVDIVDVIGEHIALKRAGREFKGLCPFHPDHRPSMAVVPHKQIFHCFVCGTGGDVFKFVELFHKMGKGEALRMLAQRAGIKLPELPGRGSGGPEKDKDGYTPRERIANTNEWACSFFEKHLRSPQGKAGLDYLYSRGLTDETIAKFRLGMSPDGWTSLVNAAMRLGISNENLLEAGLIKQRQDSSPYDAFRNRVMFPIIDATGGVASGGRVIAFGGRILVEKRDEAGNVVEAKYLNSPDSKLFNKSESLYGINLARQHIIRTRTAVVVEGYMDVIACHQAGVTNVLATLGTALTPDHARILKNYAQTIKLVFDSDDAGRRATDRAMEIFVRTPLDIKITAVPDGKDPCDYCIKNGGEAFQKLLDHAEDALDFQWNRLRSQLPSTDSMTARQDRITEFVRFVAASVGTGGGLSNIDPIRRGQLIVKLAATMGLPIEEVAQLLFRYSKLSGTAERPPSETDPVASPFKPEQPQRNSALQSAERWLIGFVLHMPELFGAVQDEITLSLFTTEFVKAELLLEYFEDTAVEERSVVGFCAYAQQKESNDPVTRAIIAWEREAAKWVDLVQFSDETAKLIRALRSDRGVTPRRVVEECLNYLIRAAEARMRLFDRNLNLGEISDDEHLKEIAEYSARNAAGNNRNSVGLYRMQLGKELEAVQHIENQLRPTG